ncbi:MAG: flagellar type III secretion system pore protein FliP, partial [Planctomycetaceae bacterium]
RPARAESSPVDDPVESERGAEGAAEVANPVTGEVRPAGYEELQPPGDDRRDHPAALEQVTRGVPFALGLAVLSIVPTVLLMTTCYIRFSIVLGMLRQGLGTPQFPPNSVLTALCLFLTCLVMRPVWQASYDRGFVPWLEAREQDRQPSLAPLVGAAVQPVRDYMSDQIERAGNSETVWMLVDTDERTEGVAQCSRQPTPTSYDQIPLPTLAAAFVLSELQVGMVIGFQILLPFLVIDLTVGLLLSILGLQGVAAGQVALPFKLLLFLLVDGWTLVVGRLMSSVGH